MKRAALALLAALALVACSSAPESGVVVEKHYDPGHTYTSVICTGKTCIPTVVVVPACAWLELDTGKTDCLSAEEYEAYEVGERWSP